MHTHFSHHAHPLPRTQVVTSAGLEGFALQDVALFLRLVYHPTDATPANLARLHTSLPAVARLAHKFVVQPLLAAIEQHLLQPAASSTSGGTSSVAALPEMLGWLDLAEELHMDDLLAVEARKAAQRLLEGLPGGTERSPSFNGISEAVQLLSLRPRTSRLVLAALLPSAGLLGSGTVGALASGLPSAKIINGWAGLELGGHGELTWEVPLSDLNSGQRLLTSPQFTVGGLVWELRAVSPGRMQGGCRPPEPLPAPGRDWQQTSRGWCSGSPPPGASKHRAQQKHGVCLHQWYVHTGGIQRLGQVYPGQRGADPRQRLPA